MNVLGINSAYHETAAALVVDGRLVAAAEEERFNRRKHGKPALVSNPNEIPANAIRWVLSAGGVAPAQIDAVAYSFDPALRQNVTPDDLVIPGDWGDAVGEQVFRAKLDEVPQELSRFLDCEIISRFCWIPHHLAHAASAYYASGFDNAAILVADGIGERASTFMAGAESGGIKALGEVNYPDSIGFLWEKMSKFLGFSEYDACKVMGLAGYGNPARFSVEFGSFISKENGGFQMDPRVLEYRLDSFRGLESVLGPRRLPGEPLTDRHADIAAALQQETTTIMLGLTRQLHKMHPAPNFCLVGGVALNCVTNSVIKDEGPFSEIFIPPAPHDAGTAFGAAMLVVNQLKNLRAEAAPSPYLGPQFDDASVDAALAANQICGTRTNLPARDAACRLARGLIVGWFQGRMEFGPRALGNRSLLADPRRRESRERMNKLVKRRESFRPFAPSILEEKSREWFHLGRDSRSFRYMLFACSVRAERANDIPAVLHVDGTARLQTVSRADNPHFHELISEFDALTGVPLVLNTSFNDREPIVCSPEDAIKTFLGTEIDALVIGNRVVDRAQMSGCKGLCHG